MNIDLNQILLMFISSMLLALAPGPDNIFVLTQSASYGAKAGVNVTLGLCTGLVFHTCLAAFGAAATLKASPFLYRIITYFGALYLLYLAFITLKELFLTKQTSIKKNSVNKTSSRSLYLRGVIMNITNPKVTLFFLAYLPQFINSGRTPVSIQMILFGLIFIISTLIVFITISLASSALSYYITSGTSKSGFAIKLVSSFIYIILAVKIFASPNIA